MSQTIQPLQHWTITYPEKFIAIMDTIPSIGHDKELRTITAGMPDVDTVFHYEKLEEGCYLFIVDMKAKQETTYVMHGDRDTEFYCLSYQRIQGPVQKTPLAKSVDAGPLESKVLSLPSLCSFYNNQFDYDTHFVEGAAVKAFIFCFTPAWLATTIDLSTADAQAEYVKVIHKQSSNMSFLSDSFYKHTLTELDNLVFNTPRTAIYNLVLKKLSLTLISDFFTIVSEPQSVINVDPDEQVKAGMNRIMQYLEQNVRKGFPGLETLAEMGGMSVSTMRRQFLRFCGYSAFDYFREVQMRYAFEQLKQGVRTKDIALYLGFKNSGNFSRLFKERYNLTPAEMKKMN
ncbi:AraC-like DNA-binding protein [Filimonas zeae]|uniref:HTH araC/xylS-type domain-containing protein n=1 Tax=Filimonas zeae TaxID=1737353 RepID=A0A917IU40_9BACT|nr:AraC family transcriptional regulator [Filimonas zeae]MDR6339583.1 AraC-like DNA-binding protein [Filimonas zeae]GGH62931.1 hypothetical protein GCM10011379_13280 [Filimonas zeae]